MQCEASGAAMPIHGTPHLRPRAFTRPAPNEPAPAVTYSHPLRTAQWSRRQAQMTTRTVEPPPAATLSHPLRHEFPGVRSRSAQRVRPVASHSAKPQASARPATLSTQVPHAF